jgi:hypothetical protein
MMQRFLFLLVLFLCVVISTKSWAFGRKNASTARQTEAALNQLGMNVKVDTRLDSDISKLLLKDFKNLKTRDLKSGDPEHQKEFAALFGGNDGQAVIQYLSKRLHGFIPNESDSEMMNRCTFGGELKYMSFLSDPSEGEKMKKAGGEVGAANLGSAFYYISAVNEVPVSCKVGDSLIPIRSTRAGLMVFGPGYKEKETVLWPFKVKIPAPYRQSILVHEARHSDCPGGLPRSGIEVARHSLDLSEFDRKFENRQCGHLHKLCPDWHPFAGLAACDDVAYGSYYFGGVFAESVSDVSKLHPDPDGGLIEEWSLMKTIAVDAFGRLTYSRDDLQSGKLGELDLSSDGEAALQ